MALIFCVEDDGGIRELISCALSSGGYQVKGFGCGKEMFDKLSTEKPQLFLLDVMLPDEDGISILRKLKADPLYSSIPVIMLTAKSSEIDKVTGLEAGADDYITKPFGIMEFLSRIKAVLRRSGSIAPPVSSNELCIRSLKIDLQQRTVFWENSEVILTFKEFELLVFLAKNQNNAISRDQLLDKVWDFQYEGETRTVDAHIKTLRHKLEAAGCSDLIQTVRGYGYKLS